MLLGNKTDAIEESIRDYYIGSICQVLDESGLHYHHLRTWFRLFPDNKDNVYAITTKADCRVKNLLNENDENAVVIYKGAHINRHSPVVFKGTLKDFKDLLECLRLSDTKVIETETAEKDIER